eukprot:1158973-Pelagomonas_calceolata.AAC.12
MPISRIVTMYDVLWHGELMVGSVWTCKPVLGAWQGSYSWAFAAQLLPHNTVVTHCCSAVDGNFEVEQIDTLLRAISATSTRIPSFDPAAAYKRGGLIRMLPVPGAQARRAYREAAAPLVVQLLQMRTGQQGKVRLGCAAAAHGECLHVSVGRGCAGMYSKPRSGSAPSCVAAADVE